MQKSISIILASALFLVTFNGVKATDDFKCPDARHKNYYVPGKGTENCGKYYECTGGKAELKTCSEGTYFTGYTLEACGGWGDSECKSRGLQ